MARGLDSQTKFSSDIQGYMLPREDIKTELGGNAGQYYFGAKVMPNQHDLNPGHLAAGMVDKLTESGAVICPATQMVSIARLSTRKFSVITNRGNIVADHVILATQGYTGSETGFLHKKVFPGLANVIATEVLDQSLLKEILPKLRSAVDTKHMFFNFRPCENENRLILASSYFRPGDCRTSADRVLRDYRKLFPELENTEAEYSWQGYIPMTNDQLPHIGVDEGIHYCVSGSFSMALYLGSKVAKKILGVDDAGTVFDRMRLRNFPLYNGDTRILYPVLRLGMNALDVFKIASPK